MDGVRVYRFPWGWRLLAFGFGAATPVLLVHAWANGRLVVRSSADMIGWVVIFAGSVALFVWLTRLFFAARIRFGNGLLEFHHGWGSRRVRLEDVVGARTMEFRGQQSYALAVKGKTKPFQVPGAMNFDDHFFRWLRSLPDLDRAEATRSDAEVMGTFDVSAAGGDAESPMALRRWFGKGLLVASVGVSAWSAFVGRPDATSVVLLILVPTLAIAVVALDRKRFRLAWIRNDARVWLGEAIVAPCIALFAISRGDFSFIFPRTVMGWSLAVGVGFGLLAVFVDRGLRARPLQALGFGALLVVGATGAVATTNCVFDRTPPRCVEAHVVGKRVNGTEYVTRLVTLKIVNGPAEPGDFQVSASAFEAMESGDPARVLVRPGRWGHIWVTVEPGTCSAPAA